MGYTPIDQGKLVPGSNHFPLLKFFKENLGYDYYWLVEDDVRFSGEWRTFFDSFAFNSSDFLSSFIETKAENPNWYWWPWLTTGAETIYEEKLLKSFGSPAKACGLTHIAARQLGFVKHSQQNHVS